MDGSQVRVVVGEGESPRKGLLRFVLEGDGYDVVAEVSTPAELAAVLAEHRPDVVVLDDGMGATAPQAVREILPRTKVVLVWPGAVVPIGGDARVEPSQVLRQLGPAVAKLAAGIAGLTTIDRPDWVEKVRKDPATLREMIERKGGLPTKRPSVTELQRRGQRLHPATPEPSEPSPAEPSREDDSEGVAPVAPLAAAAAAAAAGPAEATIELPDTPEAGAPILHLPEDEDQDRGAGVVPIEAAAGVTAATALNRRLGTIALGGAAVVGAVVLALALGGSRVPTEIIMAEGPRATIAPGPPIDSGIVEPSPGEGPGRTAGGDGNDAPPGVMPGTVAPSPGANAPSGGTDGDGGGIRGGGTEPPPQIPGGGTEPPPPGGTEPPPAITAPGKSAYSNPHGVPPGKTSDPVGTATSPTGHACDGAEHGTDDLPGHAGEHGQGIEHGVGLGATPRSDER